MKVAGMVIFACIALTACRKDPIALPPDLGYHYFPADTGMSWLYKCDSIIFDDFTGTTDTTSFYLKESFSGYFTDLEGRLSLRLERFVSYPDTNNFQLRDVWYITANRQKVESFEEDIRYVKLIFPLRDGDSWDVNAMNYLDELNYEYLFRDQPWTGAFISSDSTLSVQSIDEGNLLQIRDHEYFYGRRIGLMKMTITELSTTISGSVESGFIYKQELISHQR